MSFLDSLLADGLTAFGKIQLQTHPPKVRAEHCRDALRLAQAGDIVLRKYSCYLDGRFIPGEFTHSGIVERAETPSSYAHPDVHPASVIHAVAEGVSRIDLLDFVKDCDGFAILRPVGTPQRPYRPDAAIAFARAQVGKPYDFHFNVESSSEKITAFFCHKLSAESIASGDVRIVPTLKSVGPLTHEVYLAAQFLEDVRIPTIFRTEF